MKLLFCPVCEDVRKLHDQHTECECGASFGQYINGLHAVYGGKAMPLGLDNFSLVRALNLQARNGDRPSGLGRTFTSFVIPDECPTIDFCPVPENLESP